jgi:transcriptional regulator of arginine metabolism
MSTRTERLLIIREIISREQISNQEELLYALGKKGFSYTQATLSRDLKFLKVNKIADAEKGYIYELPDKPESDIAAEKYAVQGFISLQFSNKFGVIKTLPGYASTIAALIDRSKSFEILGTIAGDDTILVIPQESVSEQDIKNSLILIIPELKDKL